MKLNVVEIKVNSFRDIIETEGKFVVRLNSSFAAEVAIRGFLFDTPFEDKEFVVSANRTGTSIRLKEDTSIIDEEKLYKLLSKEEETGEDLFDESLFKVEELSPGMELLIDVLKNWIKNNLTKIQMAGIKHPNQWILVSKL